MREPIRFAASGFPASGTAVRESWAPTSPMLEAALAYQHAGLSRAGLAVLLPTPRSADPQSRGHPPRSRRTRGPRVVGVDG